MKRWLGYAAFQMQLARFGDLEGKGDEHGILVSRDQLCQWIVLIMARGDPAEETRHRPTAEAFVEWVARRAGLIIPRAEGVFAFAHLSFQEYFAAWFMAEQVTSSSWVRSDGTRSPFDAGPDLKMLRAASGDSRWQETLILLFELLAVRSDWSDEMLALLFEPESNAAWEMVDETGVVRLAVQRALLLTMVARDRHSGLARMRLPALYRAWYTLGDSSRHWMHGRSRADPGPLARALVASDAGDFSPGLEALTTLPERERLRAITLHGEVTDAAVQALADRCPQLQTLYLWGCDKITDGAVQALQAARPELRIAR